MVSLRSEFKEKRWLTYFGKCFTQAWNTFEKVEMGAGGVAQVVECLT
jgi:hypothetical protein